MPDFKLKSYEFRREREDIWRELEALVARAEDDGIRSLSSRELFRLPSLYRSTLSSLSVARSISLDRNVLLYLESLASRAYFLVYGARAGFFQAVAAFFGSRFPQGVFAARWHVLIAAFFLFLGVATGFVMTYNNQDWFYTFVSAEMASGRSPTSSTEDLRAVLYETAGGVTETLYTFATFLFTHNASIGMLSFALGFALGLPTILLMFYNGLTIGAFMALYAGRGLSAEFLAWLSIHGTTELLAVVLCGGAGLVLAGGIAFPGKHSRLENLARDGRLAARIVIGAVAMFLIAGLLEGLARQLITETASRYLVAAVALIWWAVYFLYRGEDRADGGDR